VKPTTKKDCHGLFESASFDGCISVDSFSIFNPSKFPDIYLVDLKYPSKNRKLILYDIHKKKEMFAFPVDKYTETNITDPFIFPGSHDMANKLMQINDTHFIHITSIEHVGSHMTRFNINIKLFMISKNDSGEINAIYHTKQLNFPLCRYYGPGIRFFFRFEKYKKCCCVSFGCGNIEKDHLRHLSHPSFYSSIETIYFPISIDLFGEMYSFKEYAKLSSMCGDIQYDILSGLKDYIIYDTTHNEIIYKIHKDVIYEGGCSINILTDVSFVGKTIKIHNKGDTKSIKFLHFVKKDAPKKDFHFIEDDIPEKDSCVICFERTKRDHIIVPCGHTQFCVACVKNLAKCPLCQIPIEKIIKIY
jgi:hypothetical protein